MTTKTEVLPKINLKIDMRLFYRTVYDHVEKNSLYSVKMIKEEDILNLIDPIISYLLKNTSFFYCNFYSRDNHISVYYDHETFIDLFDDLFLSFYDFFGSYGISRAGNYIVERENNFIVHVKECEDEKEIERIYARYNSLLQNGF